MNKSACPTASRNLAHIALVIFLVILLIQSAIGLFFSMPTDGDSIDIIFRSAISSIFGYIMSSIGQKAQGQGEKSTSQPRTIGFAGEESTTSLLSKDGTPTSQTTPPPTSWSPTSLQFQTAIIACLGLFCMVVLIALRYYEGTTAATSGVIATVAQFRDIISGSIGALIGLARGHQG